VQNDEAAEVSRDLLFMCNRGVEIGCRLILLLDGADKPVQAFKSAKLVCITEPRCIKRGLKNRKRFIIRLEGNRKRVAILAAKREREPRRIGKPNRSAMHDFRD